MNTLILSSSGNGFVLNGAAPRPRGENYEILKFGNKIAIREVGSNELLASAKEYDQWNGGVYANVEDAISAIENIIFTNGGSSSELVDIADAVENKATTQEIHTLNDGESVTFTANSICYLNISITGSDTDARVELDTFVNSPPHNFFNLNESGGVVGYEKDFSIYTDKTNPEAITIYCTSTTGIVYVEIAKI